MIANTPADIERLKAIWLRGCLRYGAMFRWYNNLDGFIRWATAVRFSFSS